MAMRIANFPLAIARPRGRRNLACFGVITPTLAAILCIVCTEFTARASSSAVPCATVDRRTVGDEYRILCPITGVSSPTRTVFTLNNLPLTSIQGVKFLQLTRLLVLSRVSERYTGTYTCTVTDANTGRVLGRICRYLIVSSTPLTRPVIDLTKASPRQKEVVPNKAETILCPATGANSAWWYKDGQPLEKPKSPSARIQWNVTSMRLHFTSFLVRDEGDYSCKASNEFGYSKPAFFYRKHKAPKEPNPKVFPKVIVSHTKGEQYFKWRLSTPPSSQEPIFRWRVRCSFPVQNLDFSDELPPSTRLYEPFSNALLKQAFSGDAVMTAHVLVRLTVRAVSSNYVGNWSEPVEASLHKPGIHPLIPTRKLAVMYDLVSTDSCDTLKGDDFLFELPLEILYIVRQQCPFCNASMPIRPTVLANASLANCRFRRLKIRVTLFLHSSEPRVVYNTLLDNLKTKNNYVIHTRTGAGDTSGDTSSRWEVVRFRVKDKSHSNTWAKHDTGHHPMKTATTTERRNVTEISTTTLPTPTPSANSPHTSTYTVPRNATFLPEIGQSNVGCVMTDSTISTTAICTLISAISTSLIM